MRVNVNKSTYKSFHKCTKWHCPLHISCKPKLIICTSIRFSSYNILKDSLSLSLSLSLCTVLSCRQHIYYKKLNMNFYTSKGDLASNRISKTWWRKTKTDLTSPLSNGAKTEPPQADHSRLICISCSYMYVVCTRTKALLNTLMGLASWKICYVFGGGYECDLWLVLFYLRLNFDFFLLSSI